MNTDASSNTQSIKPQQNEHKIHIPNSPRYCARCAKLIAESVAIFHFGCIYHEKCPPIHDWKSK
jgi:hypothetical protein